MSDEFLDHVLGGRTAEVEEAVRKAAAAEIMPRFRQLTADDIVEKNGPHDLVTVADRAAEAHLTASLTALLPGSVVVGEEAVHADPAVYEALHGDAPVWIVDPVDGTRQFVHGDPGFCTLVALARHGELLASWTYAPALEEFAVAVRGRGATLNGQPLRSGSPPPAPSSTSPPPTPTTAARTRSGPCSVWSPRASAPAPADPPDSSTWPWHAAPSTAPPSAGSTPGTTRPGCSSSPRRAART